MTKHRNTTQGLELKEQMQYGVRICSSLLQMVVLGLPTVGLETNLKTLNTSLSSKAPTLSLLFL